MSDDTHLSVTITPTEPPQIEPHTTVYESYTPVIDLSSIFRPQRIKIVPKKFSDYTGLTSLITHSVDITAPDTDNHFYSLHKYMSCHTLNLHNHLL